MEVVAFKWVLVVFMHFAFEVVCQSLVLQALVRLHPKMVHCRASPHGY